LRRLEIIQKWEYKIIIGTYETYRKLSGESQLAATDRWSKGPNMAFKNITTKTFEELNTLGKEGWEVCAVTSYDGHSNEIYLKRQIA